VVFRPLRILDLKPALTRKLVANVRVPARRLRGFAALRVALTIGCICADGTLAISMTRYSEICHTPSALFIRLCETTARRPAYMESNRSGRAVRRMEKMSMLGFKPAPRHALLASAALLVAAMALLMFANGRFPIAICSWLAPVFMLHFTRRGSAFFRLPLAFGGLTFAFAFQTYKVILFLALPYWLVCGIFGLALLAPYAVDRYIAPRWNGSIRSLVFPLTMVTSEFLLSFGLGNNNLVGSFGSIAYSQYESLTLMQLLSITGLYGITFLIGWFAAVAESLWQARFVFPRVWRECAAFGICATAVLLFGGARLALFPPASDTIRVASITRPDDRLVPNPPSAELTMRVMTGGSISAREAAQQSARSKFIADKLLGRAEMEAQAGAKVVSFGEFSFPVLKQDEAALIRRASDLAERRGIYLALPLAVYNIGHIPPADDPFVMIDPSGRSVWEYRKTELPSGEGAVLPAGTGELPAVDAPFGRLGAAVAFDMDFPRLMIRAGRNRADVMIVPENEYAAIDPLHSRMALYRAVENGFNLLLHVGQGLSLACDYQGRVYALMDHYHATDRVLVAQLPSKGVRTFYSFGGFVFPWICIVGLCLLIVTSLTRPLSPKEYQHEL
jgi:apolipoprotein N-acyltransferase